MWKSFLSTFSFWRELSKDIRIWWIFRRTANQYRDQLNKDFQLRVDWLGRIYGVVNLPEEVQTASGEIQQAYVLNKISTYGNYMLQIGLADMVYPQIQNNQHHTWLYYGQFLMSLQYCLFLVIF